MKNHRKPSGRFVDSYLPALLAQASHLISSEFHRIVNANGLSVSEWRVLATLAGGDALSSGRIEQIAMIKQSTLSRLLDRMQAAGYIRRLDHDEDRRVTLVAIAPAGNRLVQRLIPLARAHEQRVFEPFGLERTEELKAALRGIIELHRAPSADT